MMRYLTKLCNSDIELRKCCGRCFGAVPALRRRESVGFAFLKSDERLDDLTKRYPIAGNIGGMQVMRRLDKRMLSKHHLAMVGGQQKALPCQVDEDDKGVTKCDALGAPRGHADKEDKQGERIVHRQVSDRMIRTVIDSMGKM